MKNDFFPSRPEVKPMIYAYTEDNPLYEGLIKVGYTSVDVIKRVSQQYPTKRPDGKTPYKIVFSASAIYFDGGFFTDREVHDALKKHKIKHRDGEWFECSVDQLRAVFIAVKNRTVNSDLRKNCFSLRPEQQEAIERTIDYFNRTKDDRFNTPKFLWNAKMRFGKTFATYQLAKQLGFKRVLILTFKPAVEQAWNEDLMQHIDFEEWQYISNAPGELKYEDADKDCPIVCFGSFQDYLGVNKETGGIKAKNEWVHTTNWDLVVFDEYHFGAWRDSAKKLFDDSFDEDSYDSLDFEKYKKEEEPNAYNESFLPITTKLYLFLSGTPFRAINSGEFIEEQIFNWTYSDEQKAKESWVTEDNPYAALPRMVMMTYKIPEDIRKVALQGEFNEFDLNIFFSAKGKGKEARFTYEDEVQKWLDLIRGAHLETSIDELKLGAQRPALPYKDVRLLNILTHTLWFLPNVASCYAMANLLQQRQNVFYHDYTINVAAGSSAGIGLAALTPVLKSMSEPLESKTITLSCGKLTTGVTVKPWTGIFMLRNLSSPETYFQAAFRVQSPWEIQGDDYKNEILKKECYVFDFALERALKQIADYSTRLNVDDRYNGNPEQKIKEFLNFLPVLAYDGSVMISIDAGGILDITLAGTSANLLARRWQSAFLVNVDNNTLNRLLANDAAMTALSKIEGFRSLNADIITIISKSDEVKKARKESDGNETQKQKKELTAAEKEYKSKRKHIQEKLIKFATRIPIFMYLSDYREYSLKDVITRLEPGLFKKVTGLEITDFELLVSIGVFNESVMNDAIYKFKRYEDASLSYTGINKHEGESVGLFDTVLSNYDYLQMKQQESLQKDEVIPYVAKEIIPESVVVNSGGKSKGSSQIAKKNEDLSVYDLVEIELGTNVTHSIFGNGKVVSHYKKLIEVKFEGGGNKKFEFPSAIQQGIITIID